MRILSPARNILRCEPGSPTCSPGSAAIPREDLADEPMNRLARKLSENQVIQNLASHALGIARMIVHEARRREQEKRAAIRELKIIGGQAKQDRSCWR